MVRAGFALCLVGLGGVLAAALLLLAAAYTGRWAAVAAAVVAVPALIGLFAGPVVLGIGLLRRRQQL